MGELLRVQKIKDSALRLIGETVNKRKNYLQVLVNYLITYKFFSKLRSVVFNLQIRPGKLLMCATLIGYYFQVLGKFIITHDLSFYSKVLFLTRRGLL